MIRKKGLGFRVLWVLGQTKTRFVGRGALTGGGQVEKSLRGMWGMDLRVVGNSQLRGRCWACFSHSSSSSSSSSEAAELQTWGSEILVPISKSTSQIGPRIKKTKRKRAREMGFFIKPNTPFLQFSFTTLVELLGYTLDSAQISCWVFSPQLLLGTHLL